MVRILSWQHLIGFISPTLSQCWEVLHFTPESANKKRDRLSMHVSKVVL